jgi:hypothetical protein
MPTRLRVEHEKENRTMEGRSERVIEVLGRLCDQDESVEAAYLCHPAVQLITKTPKEGNLCGYRPTPAGSDRGRVGQGRK